MGFPNDARALVEALRREEISPEEGLARLRDLLHRGFAVAVSVSEAVKPKSMARELTTWVTLPYEDLADACSIICERMDLPDELLDPPVKKDP